MVAGAVARSQPVGCLLKSTRIINHNFQKLVIAPNQSELTKSSYMLKTNTNVFKSFSGLRPIEEEGEDTTAVQALSHKNVDKDKLYGSVSRLLQTDAIKNIMKEEHVSVKTFDEILEKEQELFGKKFKLPTATWIKKIKADIGHILDKDVSEVRMPNLLRETYGNPKTSIKPFDVFAPLNVGDAVELSTALNQAGMAVIVEVPSRSDDPRYTIMDRKGELRFAEKSFFKFRIPKVIPEGWANKIVEKAKVDSPGYGSIKTTVDQQFETYYVNPLARRIIMQPLLDITNDSWNRLPEVSKKLELLHRLVQGRGPKQVSLFSLAAAVEAIDIVKIRDDIESGSAQKEYLKWSSILEESHGPEFSLHQSRKLGKDVSKLSADENIEISHLYAVVLALRKQERFWSTDYSSRCAMMPLSITVNPLEYVHKVDIVVESLKKDDDLAQSFIGFVKSKNFTEIPPEFDGILFLLKEYCSGNIKDAVTETVICQLMKKTESTDTTDITRTHVYNLLTEVGYISKLSTNPEHFSAALTIPGKGVSVKADLEQEYYDSASFSENDIPDISASIRKDFGDMRVYCIDSESAHEIDDGVSIERIDSENVILHAHIADPASYLSPDDVVSKIAFERASTIYQPEIVSPMLPKDLSDLCGLGSNGKKTRAITFSVPFNFKNGADLNKAKVQPSYVSKFPKYTYETVDQTLLRTKDIPYESLNDEERDLNDLFRAAKKLRKIRIDNGAIVFGESLQTVVSLSAKDSIKDDTTLIDDTLDEGSDVLFTKQGLTDSVTLVSELMILANSVGAQVMCDLNLPGIFKGMNALHLRGSASHVVRHLNTKSKTNGELPSAADVVKCIKFISPAFYSPTPVNHLMLGIKKYLPSTSPLRRFGDLINHWQFHNYLNKGTPLFNVEQINYISMHIEIKNDIIKKAQRHSNSYYALNYIISQAKSGKPLRLSFMVWSRPSGDNCVSGTIREFGVFARLQLNSEKKPPIIGQIINELKVVEMDPVGENVILQQL